MKQYKVVLDDKREEFVDADTYQLVSGQYVFFANGEPIPDVFFRESSVVGINVVSDNIERDSGWKGGGSY